MSVQQTRPRDVQYMTPCPDNRLEDCLQLVGFSCIPSWAFRVSFHVGVLRWCTPLPRCYKRSNLCKNDQFIVASALIPAPIPWLMLELAPQQVMSGRVRNNSKTRDHRAVLIPAIHSITYPSVYVTLLPLTASVSILVASASDLNVCKSSAGRSNHHTRVMCDPCGRCPLRKGHLPLGLSVATAAALFTACLKLRMLRQFSTFL